MLLFHVNLRSSTAHFDELHTLLGNLKIPFDFIGITETKQCKDNDFLTNVTIQIIICTANLHLVMLEEWLFMSSPVRTVHQDLTEQEYAALWTEIKNPKSKSILCCCTYRHPNTDISKFTKYLSSCLSKIKSEDKLVFIMGDFNINLLNYDSHTDTSEFLDQMVSRCFLPYVLHPTRVTDHCATVIDNTFYNNT